MPNLKNNDNLTTQSGTIKYSNKRTISGNLNLSNHISGNSYIKKLPIGITFSQKRLENEDIGELSNNKDKMKVISKYNKVIDELENNNLKKQLNNDLIRVSVDTIANFIIGLSKYKFTVEITSDDSIFFTIVMNNGIEIHYDFFVEEVGKEKEVLFSLYQNKKCLIYGWDNIENSFKRLNKVLEQFK